MTDLDFLACELASRYGTVKRARGFFLYTAKGRRLTDLFQEGGRAILGWGGSAAFTVLKDVLSRGLTGSYLTDFGPRLEKALSCLLGTPRKAFVFSDRAAALEAALNVAPDGTAFFRPWRTDGGSWTEVPAVILEPPLPWAADMYVLAVLDTVELELRLAHVQDMFRTAREPAALVAAVIRAVYDLIAAMQARQEKDWFVYDTVLTKYWLREGPYLFPRQDVIGRESYRGFIAHCLDCGLVISPRYEVPSIVPVGVDRGVFGMLARRPFESVPVAEYGTVR